LLRSGHRLTAMTRFSAGFEQEQSGGVMGSFSYYFPGFS